MTSPHTKTFIFIAGIALIIIGILWYNTSVSNRTNNIDTSPNPTESTDVPTSLAGTTWTWVRTDTTSTSLVAPLDRFVLSFEEGGRFNSTTDCNNIGGEFTTTGTTLTFGSMISTMMFCENSQESVYSADLGKVISYSLTGNELRLILSENAGTMVFKRGK